MGNTGEGRRLDLEVGRLTEATERLARALYVLPSILAAVALATPVADLRLPGDDADEPRTLLGMLGEFSDLRSAGGVHPVVVILLGALLTVLVTGLVVAWGGEDRRRFDVDTGRSAPRRTGARIRPAAILVTAAAVLILLALPLLLALDAADHVDNSSRNPPFVPQLGGAGMLVLTGIVAVIVARTDWRVRD